MIQVSKRNTARLQYLAHFIAESLVSIAENMAGRWDDASATIKTRLDEYEAWVLPLTFMINSSYLNHRILRDVFKVVKRRTSSSAVISFFNAGDRDFDIAMLEKRLTNTQISLLES